MLTSLNRGKEHGDAGAQKAGFDKMREVDMGFL